MKQMEYNMYNNYTVILEYKRTVRIYAFIGKNWYNL